MASTWNSYQPQTPSIWLGRVNEEPVTSEVQCDDVRLQTGPSSGRETEIHNRFQGIIGSSAALKRVVDQVRTVAPIHSTVLIEGETGTGKQLLALSRQHVSQRRDRRCLRSDFAAIQPRRLR